LLGNDKTTRLATEEELAGADPMFELGAVPPFGGPAGDRIIADRPARREGVDRDRGGVAYDVVACRNA
jgi:hypothetical protein